LQIVRYLDAPAGLGEFEVVDKRMWERGDGGDERASRDARAVRENGFLAACCHELRIEQDLDAALPQDLLRKQTEPRIDFRQDAILRVHQRDADLRRIDGH